MADDLTDSEQGLLAFAFYLFKNQPLSSQQWLLLLHVKGQVSRIRWPLFSAIRWYSMAARPPVVEDHVELDLGDGENTGKASWLESWGNHWMVEVLRGLRSGDWRRQLLMEEEEVAFCCWLLGSQSQCQCWQESTKVNSQSLQVNSDYDLYSIRLIDR